MSSNTVVCKSAANRPAVHTRKRTARHVKTKGNNMPHPGKDTQSSVTLVNAYQRAHKMTADLQQMITNLRGDVQSLEDKRLCPSPVITGIGPPSYPTSQSLMSACRFLNSINTDKIAVMLNIHYRLPPEMARSPILNTCCIAHH